VQSEEEQGNETPCGGQSEQEKAQGQGRAQAQVTEMPCGGPNEQEIQQVQERAQAQVTEIPCGESEAEMAQVQATETVRELKRG